MTRRSSSRLAGVAFLVYIAAAFSGMILEGKASAGEGAAAKLASIAQNARAMRAAILLQLVGCFCALVLAVTLYAITRDRDPDLALLAMVCRVAEGVIGAVSLPRMAGRLWLATASAAGSRDPAAAGAIGASLFGLPTWNTNLGATFFAVGSTLFAWLMLRGRIVSEPLAWLGVVASVLVLGILPLELVGLAGRPITDFMWLPMLVFEVWLALWLIVRGAALPRREEFE
jgi:uncharacterized protein DUF4386